MIDARPLLALIILLAVGAIPQKAAAEGRPCHARVEAARGLIAALHEPAVEVQLDAGRRLVELTDAAPARCARALLPLLVASLRDREDRVRYYAASAIAALGAPARSAVPALEAATKLDKCVCFPHALYCFKQSLTSTAAIEQAVIELTGSEGDPTLYGCAHSGSVEVPEGESEPPSQRPNP